MRIVTFYLLLNGSSPIKDFLDSLTGEQAKKVLWVLKLVEDMDILPRQYFKKLTGREGIWEVRVGLGNDIFRLLGFLSKRRFLIPTNAFVKKTQKTPKREIALAIQRKKEYLSRKK